MQFSVAMCTYNGALYLREQLESIGAQNRTPDELIVCDDHSEDETREIIRAFASASSFPVRLHVNESRLGVIRNFERAIKLCAGDIIVLADQDDVWHREKLQRTGEAFSSNAETGLVLSDAEVVDKDLRSMGYCLWQATFNRREQRLFDKEEAFSVLSTHNVATGATMAFRAKYRDLILPIPDDTSLIHDGWIASLIAAVAKVSLIRQPLIKYRQHPSQQLGIRLPDTKPAPERFFGKQRANAAMLGKASFLEDIDRLNKIRERLLTMKDVFDGAKPIKFLEAKTSHIQTRVSLHDKESDRISPILKELLAGHYHLYSKGIRSAARDFWF